VCTHIDDGGAFTRARAEPMAVHAAAATGAAFAPGTPPPHSNLPPRSRRDGMPGWPCEPHAGCTTRATWSYTPQPVLTGTHGWPVTPCNA
jgi:hypothetical protein